MNRRRLRNALALGLLLALLAAGALARWAFQVREKSLPPEPVTRVPESWHEFRDAPGHVVHVGERGIACVKCHDPARGFGPPRPRVCVSCHEREGRTRHGLHAAKLEVFAGTANCMACHNFGPTHQDRIWACLDCHDKPQGELGAVVVHADRACSNCHHPHNDPSIEPMACVSCHAKEANSHAGKPSTSPDNCLSCHQAHAGAKLADQRCQQCHKDKPQALFKGHPTCAGCHVPHDFARSAVKPCRSCHQSQHVLAEDKVAAHRQCTSCHEPHAVAQADDNTCRKCHSSVAPTHPQTEGHACLGCHRPHSTAAAVPPAQPCTSCHAPIASSDQAAHGGRAQCTDCHKPHAFAKPAQAEACVGCHAVQLAAIAKNTGHATCLGCHRGTPHAAQLATGLAPVACTSCHKDVHPRPEHAQCTRCHEPHSGAPLPLAQSCGSCHQRQEHASVAPHRACLTCHTPHEGGKLPAASCTGCHAVKAKQNHGALAGGCTQCHGIHSDKGVLATPACTSCHQVGKLPGLHSVQAHQQCVKCHGGAHNQGPWSARATCLACHQKKKDHAPNAQLCQGCHVFRK